MARASGGQLSFFSADAHPRAVTDLEGVLCARGQLSVFGRGTTARLSIVLGDPPVVGPDEEGDDVGDDAGGDAGGDVEPAGIEDDVEPSDVESSDVEAGDVVPPDDEELFDDVEPPDAVELELLDVVEHRHDAEPPDAEPPDAPAPPTPDPVAEWRAHALCCAFRTRGVDAEIDRLDDGRPVVRSAYRADLVPLAEAWTRGAVKAVPADLELDGPRLRLWILAAGRHEGRAYVLALDPHAPGTHEALLTASRRAGLGATLGGDRAAPVLRIVGRRRQARLAELAGGRPSSTVDGIWPG